MRFLACGAMLAVTAGVCAAEQSSSAVTVELTHEVGAEPSRVWAVIGDPGLAMLVPALVDRVDVSGAGVGAERTLYFPQGAGAVKERIIARDDAAMTYTYSVIDFGPVPWLECTGIWSVRATGHGHSRILQCTHRASRCGGAGRCEGDLGAQSGGGIRAPR